MTMSSCEKHMCLLDKGVAHGQYANEKEGIECGNGFFGDFSHLVDLKV